MAKGIPAGYTRFLEKLLSELPELSRRDPQLADRLQGARMLTNEYMIKISHPLISELRWAFRGESERNVGKLGEIQWSGELYEAPSSHRPAYAYKATIRFDLTDDSQMGATG